MAVHDGIDIGTGLVDLAVDEALNIHESPGLIDRIGIEVVFHDVRRGDDRGRLGARQEISIGRMGMTHAYMAIAVEDALVGQDAVGRDQVFDGSRVDRAARPRRGAGCLMVHANVTNVPVARGPSNNQFAGSDQACEMGAGEIDGSHASSGAA